MITAAYGALGGSGTDLQDLTGALSGSSPAKKAKGKAKPPPTPHAKKKKKD